MDTQSLHNILYLFLDWHPARIKTFTELIWGVVKARTVRIKELAMYVASNGNLHAKIIKVERLFLLQPICFIILGKIIVKLRLKLQKRGKSELELQISVNFFSVIENILQ